MSRNLGTPPILASIVLIDIFEPPTAASLRTRSAASSRGTASRERSARGSPCTSPAPLNLGVPSPTSPLASLPLPAPARFATSPGSASLSPSPRGAQTPQIDAVGEVPSDGRMVIGGGAMYALIGGRVWLAPQALRAVIDRSPGTRRAEGTRRQGGISEISGGRGEEFQEGKKKEVGSDEGNRGESSLDSSRPVATDDLGDDDFDDLPIELEEQLRSYGPEMWVFNRVPGARVPRARIGYDDAVRSYAHIVKPVMRSGAEIAHGPLSGAEWLHVPPPYSSTALLALVSDLSHSAPEWHPRIVFEPAPTSCHPAELGAFERAAPHVEVLSPNHEELLSLYSRPLPDASEEIVEVVEEVVRHLLDVGVGKGGRGTIAVRCSSLGACVGTVAQGVRWIPSFFEGEQQRVQDVTGAGNAFIGGYIAGLSLTGDPYTAALHGTVSASFVIEQLGPPSLTVAADEERWNGDSAEHRLAVLSSRVGWA